MVIRFLIVFQRHRHDAKRVVGHIGRPDGRLKSAGCWPLVSIRALNLPPASQWIPWPRLDLINDTLVDNVIPILKCSRTLIPLQPGSIWS